MTMTALRKETTKFPIWMKMFSNRENDLDPTVLKRIARALQENKSVTILNEGKPVRISIVDGEVKIETFASVKYQFGE